MRIFVFSLLVLALVTALGVDLAMAQDTEIYCETKALLEGGLGQAIGLMVGLLGLLTFLKGGGFFGLIMIIMGVLVTVAPQLLTSILLGLDAGVSGTNVTGNDFKPPC